MAYAIERARGVPLSERLIVGTGPAGEAGKIVCHPTSDDAEICYDSDRQAWRQIPGEQGFVGWLKGMQMQPEQLARREQIAGQLVTLADGNEWIVPTARAPVEDYGTLRYQVRLPRTMQFDDDGNWIYGDVESRFDRLMTIADKWSAVRFSDDDDEIDVTVAEATAMAVEALGYNYRVGPIEVSALRLINQQTVGKILDAVIDFDAWWLLVQKKTSASEQHNMSDGNAA